MKTSQCNIGVFISSMSISDSIKDIAKSRKDTFYYSYKSLEDSISVGKEFEAQGVEVLISRRGTAHLLRENLGIPVLSFPQSSLSVLASVKKAKEKLDIQEGRRMKVFMPNFRNEISGLEIVSEIFDVEFVQGLYQDSTSLSHIIAKAAKEGFDAVVGGISTMGYAIKYGLHFQELTNTKEDILETIENAKSAAYANREEKARSRRYQSIMDLASDAIFAVDSAGNISMLNQKTRDILEIKDDVAIGKSFSEVVPYDSIKKSLKNQSIVQDKIEKINNNMFVYNQVPLTVQNRTVGVVATLKEVAHVMRTENKVRRTLSRGFVAKYVLEDLIYASNAMEKLKNSIRELGKTDSTVVIMGETGTGKEVVAQSIHNIGSRSKMPFVSVNCGAIPDQLLESELFGHEEGAFTGSKKGGKPGLFEIAHQGTIFLDEIDSTSQNVQLLLLRVLQEKEVMRIGADRKIPVDVRVIAAAGKDLWAAVMSRTFRKDLFFRLNVLRITIPPLRNRGEDISLLLSYFTDYFSKKYGIEPISFPLPHLKKLLAYSWPGNVRQLKHFTEQIMLTSNFQKSMESIDFLIDELLQITDSEHTSKEIEPAPVKEKNLKLVDRNLENEQILRALKESQYSKAKAAELLGISRTTLWRKLKSMQ